MQGGGKKMGTNDHLLILNVAIRNKKKRYKPIYITFLDVEKAYDKCYLTGALDALFRSGLDDRNFCYIKNLNENNSAILKTHVGDTREIFIKGNLRQGGVLSGIAYSTLTDEIAKKIMV